MKKLLCVSFVFLASTLSHQCQAQQAKRHAVIHDTIEVDGVEVFYREAGPSDAPTILLLHGYPTSSHMFRNLIQELAGQYHLIAPDYPGYGRSEQPPIDEFEYSFSGMSKLIEKFLMLKKIERYSLYLMDYGAPIGYRIAIRHPERVQGLIIQNGCAYEDGLLEFWDPIKKYWEQHNVENGKALEGFHQPDGLKWQYTHGTGEREREVSPDNWEIDLRHLNRPGNNAIQLAMFYDYRTNVELYPKFQAFFRKVPAADSHRVRQE